MQPKMHCSVEGNALAAVIDRLKIDISRTRNAELPGATLNSTAILSTPLVPAMNSIWFQ